MRIYFLIFSICQSFLNGTFHIYAQTVQIKKNSISAHTFAKKFKKKRLLIQHEVEIRSKACYI